MGSAPGLPPNTSAELVVSAVVETRGRPPPEEGDGDGEVVRFVNEVRTENPIYLKFIYIFYFHCSSPVEKKEPQIHFREKCTRIVDGVEENEVKVK